MSSTVEQATAFTNPGYQDQETFNRPRETGKSKENVNNHNQERPTSSKRPKFKDMNNEYWFNLITADDTEKLILEL